MRLLAAVAFAFVLLACPRVRAQDDVPETAWVIVGECAASPVNRDELLARLRVELTSDGVGEIREVGASGAVALVPGGGVALVRIDATPCQAGAAGFTVHIDDHVTHKRVERAVDLSDVIESARPRALALATAELLRASWAELALDDTARAAEAPPVIVRAVRTRVAAVEGARSLGDPLARRSPPPAPPGPPPRAALLAIAAAFVVRAFPEGNLSPVGGRLSLDLPLLSFLVLRVDLEAASGNATDPLGTIDLGFTTAGLTAVFAAALGADARVTVGPRVAGGIAWTAGHPYDAATLAGSGTGPVLLVGGAAELTLRFASSFWLVVGLSADATPVAFHALVSGEPAAGIAGGSLAAWVGLAVTP